MVKKILSIVLWVITGGALIVLFAFGRSKYLETPLKGIELRLERSHTNGFVDRDQLMLAAQAYGKSPYGAHLKAEAEGRVRY